MQIYKTKSHRFAGTDFHEVRKKDFGLYTEIKRKSKRRTYVRSVYFNKEKIFLDLFWQHLFDKEKWQDRFRRVKYFGCAIELMQKSRFAPKSKENPNKPSEILHRFYGSTADNEAFYVQIKEERKISVRAKSFSSRSSLKNEKDLPLSVVYEPRAESLFHT